MEGRKRGGEGWREGVKDRGGGREKRREGEGEVDVEKGRERGRVEERMLGEGGERRRNHHHGPSIHSSSYQKRVMRGAF